MKYVITGSTGHISKPLAQQLVAAGKQVTIITSSAAKTDEIKALGAQAAVGSVNDRDFLTRTFAGADAVYLMIPPPPHSVTDWPGLQKEVADNYIAAVKASKVKYILVLSSMGAHMRNGAGPIDGTAYLEVEAEKLTDVHLHILRPSGFFYNLFAQMGMIKNAGFVASTQPANFKLLLTDPSDIANAAARYLLNPGAAASTIEYIVSDDTNTWADITKTLGAAIGKPELKYVELTDEQSRAGMLQAGLNPAMVEGFVTMGRAVREGNMQGDFLKTHLTATGKVKLVDFAKQFAGAFSAS